jgi:branched-chain amino acid transport system ATP-binding protein
MPEHAILEIKGLAKRFGGLQAVGDVSFTAARGAITALIGPNGAGKTTLFALISGFIRPDAGSVLFDGRDISGVPAHRVCHLGLTRTFQIVQPFAGLTVRENIAIGAHRTRRGRREALAAAEQVAARIGMDRLLDRQADELTISGRKRLELARALATEPTLILLDEVLAGLNPTEIEEILPVIRTIRDGGVSVLMIEHVMAAVMKLSDEVHVLAQGRLIAGGRPAEVAADPAVIEAYLGHGAAARMAGMTHG